MSLQSSLDGVWLLDFGDYEDRERAEEAIFYIKLSTVLHGFVIPDLSSGSLILVEG